MQNSKLRKEQLRCSNTNVDNNMIEVAKYKIFLIWPEMEATLNQEHFVIARTNHKTGTLTITVFGDQRKEENQIILLKRASRDASFYTGFAARADYIKMTKSNARC